MTDLNAFTKFAGSVVLRDTGYRDTISVQLVALIDGKGFRVDRVVSEDMVQHFIFLDKTNKPTDDRRTWAILQSIEVIKKQLINELATYLTKETELSPLSQDGLAEILSVLNYHRSTSLLPKSG